MCGIFGVASKDIKGFPLRESTDLLSHRGPDGSGLYNDGEVGLGHRRLKIIDLEGGDQPIFNEDRTKCIVFNGEIYNYKELKETLTSKGHIFATRSDTEAILHAYEEWGDKCVEQLRGMFAFAIRDKPNGTLFIARDRTGIKPLFYAEHNGRFYFSSEMKAILADQEFPRDIDREALACYFNLSYIPAPLTIYKKIRKLLPGHYLVWKDGTVRISKYWDLLVEPDRAKSEEYFISGVQEILQESVKIHLMSDVPLGAFLSGGVDSSAVVAMMSNVSPDPVNTISIGFGGEKGGYLDERVYAKMVAERYSTKHKEYEVVPEIDGLLEKIVRGFDEPFADDSTIPSYFVCKVARESVTVALSGLGGDELFAGYERYLGVKLQSVYNGLPLFFRKSLATIVGRFPERADGHYTVNHIKRFSRSSLLPPDQAYYGFISKINPRLKEIFFADAREYKEHFDNCRELVVGQFNSPNVSQDASPLDRALYCDIKTYLPEDILAVTDRMSMIHSLEVRVPFLDHKLMEFCATIPANLKINWFNKKYLLKKSVEKLLPEEVITHRKQGFVGPMTSWIRKDLKEYIIDALSDEKLDRHSLLNKGTVSRILDEHFQGREIHDTLIWSLVVFQKWFDLYIDNRGAATFGTQGEGISSFHV